jgi:hypothetical protein
VRQRKTGRPVRFELTEHTRQTIDEYLATVDKKSGEYLFNGLRPDESMSTRQYARLLADWLVGIGLDPHVYGTHSLRQTKATLIYRRTGNKRSLSGAKRTLSAGFLAPLRHVLFFSEKDFVGRPHTTPTVLLSAMPHRTAQSRTKYDERYYRLERPLLQPSETKSFSAGVLALHHRSDGEFAVQFQVAMVPGFAGFLSARGEKATLP